MRYQREKSTKSHLDPTNKHPLISSQPRFNFGLLKKRAVKQIQVQIKITRELFNLFKNLLHPNNYC